MNAHPAAKADTCLNVEGLHLLFRGNLRPIRLSFVWEFVMISVMFVFHITLRIKI